MVIYPGDSGSGIQVRVSGDSVWVTQGQLVDLFDSSPANISEHIAHIFEDGELVEEATVRNFRIVQKEGSRQVARTVKHFNLDVALSVGYRVKSKTATQFRMWATNILRTYLAEGYVANESRLRELEQVVRVIARSADPQLAGTAEIVASYLPALKQLRQYDEGSLESGQGTEPKRVLTYDDAREVIDRIAREFPEDTMLGGERGQALHAVVEAIYQGFAGQEIYPTVQLKAANLLYLVVKDHPLTDGNKRSAAALFVHFLELNDRLNSTDGAALISNNTLAAVTLMVAMSEPSEKELMIALISRMLSD